MSSSLKLLSKINAGIKYCVYGWIREVEKELNINSIPNGICSIIILFCRSVDRFDIVPDDVKVSDDGMSITNTNENEQDAPCYGKLEIDPTVNECRIYQWDLKIHHISVRMTIGIVSFTPAGDIPNWLSEKDGYFYGIHTNHNYNSFKVIKTEDYALHGLNNEQDFKSLLGQTVSIYYDTHKKELRYSIDGSEPEIAHQDINIDPGRNCDDITYRLIVVLAAKDDCVEMLNFFEYDHE